MLGRQEDVHADGAFGGVAVVFKLECVVVLGVCVFGILAGIILQRGETEGRAFEVDECLQCRRGIMCLDIGRL